MKKVFLLSGLILCFSGFAFSQESKVQKQNPKGQNQDSKVQKQNPKVQNKASKELTTETKSYLTEWDKKVIEELNLSELQVAKLEALNKEYDEKLFELMQNAKTIEKKQSSEVSLVQVESVSAQSVRISDAETQKPDSESEIKKAEFEEKKIALKKDKEKLFIEMLTPKQHEKYKEMIEQNELKKKETQADKQLPKEPVKQIAVIEQ